MRSATRIGRGLVYGLGLLGAIGATMLGERQAAACGGCVQPPPTKTETESVITDEKMLFSISKDQTTLYDEITYSGSPASFGWVLPIRGEVTVGLSADILFATLEQFTATQVTSPPTNCPTPSCNRGVGCGSSNAALPGAALDTNTSGGGGAAGAGRSGTPPVQIISQKQVGPYETVQLKSSDGSALNNWLAKHGYVVQKDEQSVIDAYVAQHFDFLALKLIPGKGVQTMQPVRVTAKGAGLSLPLHMVAVGTGATTGITIWVVADARWEPANFPFFTISDSELVWDWTTSSSNYESLRLSKEQTYNGRGWQLESSLELSKYAFESSLVSNAQGDTAGTGGGYLVSDAGTGGPPAGEGGSEAGGEGGSGGGGAEAGSDVASDFDGAATEDVPSDAATEDYGYPSYDGASLGTSGQAEAVQKDMEVLFKGIGGPNFRVTRMRSDVAHAALSVDMFLQASKDQSELTNQHTATQETGQPLCPVYDDNCVQTGTAPRDQAIADSNGGCNATRSTRGARTTIALMIGLVGASALRLRLRRRRAQQKK